MASYVALATAGSFQFGYGIAVMNTMKETVGEQFGWQGDDLLNKYSQLASAVFLGAACAAMPGGMISAHGRRLLNLIVHACYVVSGVFSFFSNSFATLILGRLIAGVGVGFSTVACPMWISEVSPIESRGSTGVLHQLFVTVGILVAVVGGSPLNAENPWISRGLYMRSMFAFPALLSGVVLLIIIFWKRDETPNYYAQTGRRDQAREMLKSIYKKDDVQAELDAISSPDGTSPKTIGLCSALRDRWYRKAIFVGIFMSLGQQISGINAFVTLSTDIFKSAGLTGSSLSLANTAIVLGNVIMTLPAIYVVEAAGRRPVYIGGNLGQTISLALVPITILAPWRHLLDTVAVVSVFAFIICFAAAYGPVLWIYLAEMFPPEISAPAQGVCAAANWLAGISVVYGVALLQDPKYMFWTFSFFTLTSGMCFVFGIIMVKETQGRFNTDSPFMEGRVKDAASLPLAAGSDLQPLYL